MSADPRPLDSVSKAYARFNDHRYSSVAKGVLGFALLAALPYLSMNTILGGFLSVNILIVTLVFAYTSQAWNIVSGFTGYFSFGHAAFFGIGAYIAMKIVVAWGVNPWLGLLAGAVVAGVVGLVIGYLNFRYRLSGHYFALATFAFAILLQVTFQNLKEFGGAVGIYRPLPREYMANPEYGLVAMQFRKPEPYYYVILAFLVVVTLVAWLIKESQMGLYLFAIRENEDAAASIGISTFRYKMAATGISAFFTAWAGTFWAFYLELIRPETVFGLFKNVQILLPTVVGGLGTIPGSIVGAFAIFPLSEFLRTNFENLAGADDIVYGLALIIIALLLPNGVLSLPNQVRSLLGRDDDHD
jgi:branched-chain amino acid transport system permease protein